MASFQLIVAVRSNSCTHCYYFFEVANKFDKAGNEYSRDRIVRKLDEASRTTSKEWKGGVSNQQNKANGEKDQAILTL
jgi:hypothetical protein